MSRTIDVIRNKNKIEKSKRERSKKEMDLLRTKTAFKARLYDELKHIDVILEDDNIQSIVIEIPDKSLPVFMESLYSEELANYDIEQDEKSPNRFRISKKLIAF